jgi:uncharacterized coiled-coil protein SlyX
MEDQDREMGSIKSETGEVKERSKGKDRLTIMIFRKVGKVRTIKVSPRLLLCASIFFLIYIVATIFLTNAFFDAYRTTKMQAKKIAKLTEELAETREALKRSKQHIALLNEYLREEKEQTPEPMSTVDYTESSFPKVVELTDLKVKRDSSALEVNFKIVNTESQERPIGGYIFVIARVKNSEESEIWVYPSASLKNGKPINYRRGHRFFIQRFKTVTGRYTLNKDIDDPLILEILVYDRNGGLILRKVVEV